MAWGLGWGSRQKREKPEGDKSLLRYFFFSYWREIFENLQIFEKYLPTGEPLGIDWEKISMNFNAW